MNDEPDPHPLPIDGTLDLHTFRPGETRELIAAYIEACLEAKIYLLRLIHGKGSGTQRRIVQSVLERHAAVESFCTDPGPGGWGATLVNLRRSE